MSTTPPRSKQSQDEFRKQKIEAIEDILKQYSALSSTPNSRKSSYSSKNGHNASNHSQNTSKGTSKNTPISSQSPPKQSQKAQKTLLVNKLRQFCITKYGLVSTELRQRVWPVIFGIDVSKLPHKPNRTKVRENNTRYRFYKWFNQVQLDVNRSASRMPANLSPEQKEAMQENLSDLILHILSQNPDLHYYQGYHDITITILQVCGLRLAMPVAERLTRDYLRDFMMETMDRTALVLEFIFPLIKEMDPELYIFLKESEVGSYFALSWLLTWYGHVIKDLKRTCRIYDFFMAGHPTMPMYLAAEIILHRREEILSTDCDMPSVHHLLTSLANVQLPDDELIQNAVLVFIEKPPSGLVDENDELRFYKDLFMANHQEYCPDLFDSLESSPVNSPVNTPSTSKTSPKTSRQNSRTSIPEKDQPTQPKPFKHVQDDSRSFITQRREYLSTKETPWFKAYRQRTGLSTSEGDDSVRKKRSFGQKLGRFFSFASAGAVFVAVAGFWVQKYLEANS